MRIYDISVAVTPELATWPGDPKIIIDRFSKIEAGDDANVSRISFCVHSGTHVDAPNHFIAEGITVDLLPLEDLIGNVQVFELPDSIDRINKDVVSSCSIKPNITKVLFKTRNSQFWENLDRFRPDFVAISADGAEALVEKGVRLVGVDYLSVAPFDDPTPTHQILLSHQVIALEGINLSNVPAGTYQLICLPIKLAGSDGAPARAVLIDGGQTIEV